MFQRSRNTLLIFAFAATMPIPAVPQAVVEDTLAGDFFQDSDAVPIELENEILDAILGQPGGTPIGNVDLSTDVSAIDKTTFGTPDASEQQYGIELLRELSSLGRGDATVRLGAAYELGYGVQRDPSTAFAYYSQAAEQGSSLANVAVAKALQNGMATEPDFRSAIGFYRVAQELGSWEATRALGRAYEYGLGVDANAELSSGYWETALELAPSEPDLIMDYVGFRSQADTVKEIGLDYKEPVSRAAELGNAKALAAAYYIARDAGDDQEKKNWFDASIALASDGNLKSSIFLGDVYSDVSDDAFSPEIAAKFYEQASAAGSSYAQYSLAELVLNFPDIPLGYTSNDARELLKVAALRGEPKAYLKLAALAIEEDDEYKAFNYSSKAAELGGKADDLIADQFRTNICREAIDVECEPLPIFFITNRERLEEDGSVIFANTMSSNGVLSNGLANVSVIPPEKRTVEEQSFLSNILRSYFGPDDDAELQVIKAADVEKHVYGSELQTFMEQIKKASEKAHRERIVVYIHGFANSFDDAARRIALWSEAGKYPGIPILMSWASANLRFAELSPGSDDFRMGYLTDRSTVMESCRYFRPVLEQLVTNFGSENVTVVAHSMGAHLVDLILGGCPYESIEWKESDRFGNLIFAAPDIDSNSFGGRVDNYRHLAESITIYVSANDVALQTASRIDGNRRRLGQGGAGRFVSEGIMTIDATLAESRSSDDAVNHAYVFEVPQVKHDIIELIGGGVNPDLRKCPARDTQADKEYWLIQPGCLQ